MPSFSDPRHTIISYSPLSIYRFLLYRTGNAPERLQLIAEPQYLKPMAPPHASSGGALRSIPHYTPWELRRIPPLPFIHGLKIRGFLRRRVRILVPLFQIPPHALRFRNYSMPYALCSLLFKVDITLPAAYSMHEGAGD